MYKSLARNTEIEPGGLYEGPVYSESIGNFIDLRFKVCRAPSHSQSLLRSFISSHDSDGTFELRMPSGFYIKVKDMEPGFMEKSKL